MAGVEGMNADSREVLVVGNPFSGKRGNQRYVEKLMHVLHGRRLHPKALWKPDQRNEALSQPDLPERYRCVIIAGGDGTVRDVLSLRPAAPLGIFPLGNENLFAKEFRFNLDPNRLADCIERGESQTVDVGVIRSECFGVVVSAGFDADVVHRVAKWRLHSKGLKRVNNLSYIPRILSALVAYDSPTLTLETEQGKITGYHIFVLNMNRYGMGVSLAPEARYDDGLLDWVVFTKPGRFNLLAYLTRLVLKRELPASSVVRGRSSKLTIRSADPMPVEVDGDAFGVTPVDLRIQPEAVRVLKVD